MKLSCIVLASGKSQRFGANKLLQKFNGKTLIEIALDTIPKEYFEKIIVVTKYMEIVEIAKSKGLIGVLNIDADKGIGTTIRKGMEFANDTDGCMFSVCDQPLRNRLSIIKLINLFNKNNDSIVALSYHKKRGNPVIFHKNFYNELKSVGDDQSGGSVIKNHEDKLLLCEIDNQLELFDVDTMEDLLKLHNEQKDL